MALFRYYFFKEHNRSYDSSDLIAFFSAIPNITIDKQREDRKIHYKNTFLNFEADFIISNKSVVPNLDKLNPKYLDLNIRLEFSMLLQNYKLDILINIVEQMCKRFNFAVYNEIFEDVSPYRRGMLIKAFDVVKVAYKKTYEDEIALYNKLEQNTLNQVYTYLEQRKNLMDLYQSEHVYPLEYLFYGQKGMRQAFVSVKWDGLTPFVMPPCVDVLTIYENKIAKIISYKEFETKVQKYLKPVESNMLGLVYVTPRDMKKVRKIIIKGKFSPLTSELNEINLDKILDV